MALDQIPRVSILRTAVLPVDVAAAVRRRVRWLRSELKRLDAELGVPFPPIEIAPVGWQAELRDGTGVNVPGFVAMRENKYVNCFIVRLAAPVLLEYPNDLIRGILAHEFLHVVCFTLELADRFPSRRAFRLRAASECGASMRQYRRFDLACQADPSAWLSPRLQRLLAEAEDFSRPNPWLARVISNWVDRDLPVEELPFEPDDQDSTKDFSPECLAAPVYIDDAIIARASRLAESSGPSGAPSAGCEGLFEEGEGSTERVS